MSTGGFLIDKQQTLLDEEDVRYTRAEALSWLNEAILQILMLRPDAKTARATMDLAAGIDQTIPAASLRLIKVIRNDTTASKRAITLISSEEMDEFNPDWAAKPQALVIDHYMHDPLTPKEYRVYPPAKTGAKAQIVTSVVPAEMADENDDFPLDATYEPAALDWICYRALEKDLEAPDSATRAQMYFGAFNFGLTGKTGTDKFTRPGAAQAKRVIPSET